jgi:hypothetical protein
MPEMDLYTTMTNTSVFWRESIAFLPFPANEWPSFWQAREWRQVVQLDAVSGEAAATLWAIQVATTEHLAVADFGCGTVYWCFPKDHYFTC